MVHVALLRFCAAWVGLDSLLDRYGIAGVRALPPKVTSIMDPPCLQGWLLQTMIELDDRRA